MVNQLVDSFLFYSIFCIFFEFTQIIRNNRGEKMSSNEKINKLVQETKPKRKVLKNVLMAFIFGGLICVFAQAIIDILKNWMDDKAAGIVGVVVMVFIGSVLTGFGLYDRIGQIAGAGTIVPITGFSNSMTSSAIESKSEGLVVGIITNMFKLAGSVIVAGVISAFVVASFIYLFEVVL